MIRILPEAVANKIAAGEVVERPASIVKELLENSVDAGASRIDISVEGGGRRLIRVEDDGCGMNRDDAMLAFERHATSKITSIEDLFEVKTLGFRGEALPSIASVARVTLETRRPGDDTGTRLEIPGGRRRDVAEIVRNPGTLFEVRDVFYNTPARRKFLKSESTELGHIASLVVHYALAHPEKAIRLASTTNEILNVTAVAPFRERIYQALGNQLLEQLIEIPPAVREMPAPAYLETGEEPSPPIPTKLWGFVSRPEVQRLNRNQIFFFVNRRLVRDRLILHAITEAFRNILSPHVFPVALVFLELPQAEVDVNVHPSKTEVRFRHSQFIHDFARDTIRRALLGARSIPNFPARPGPRSGWAAPIDNSEVETAERLSEEIPGSHSLNQGGARQGMRDSTEGARNTYSASFGAARRAGGQPDFHLTAHQPPPQTIPLPLCENPVLQPWPAPGAPAHNVISDGPASMAVERAGLGTIGQIAVIGASAITTHARLPLDVIAEKDQRNAGEFPARLQPLGQVENSFIVAANADGLWIIDQHVAHERINFEKHLKMRRERKVEGQRLLLPSIVELKPQQQATFHEIAEELTANGFEVEPFGPRTVAIKTAPAGIRVEDLEQVLVEVLDGVAAEARSVTLGTLLTRIAATVACHASIKVHMPRGREKMEWLLQELARTECPMTCPHGRPVMLRYSLHDIQKAFKRI